MGNGTEFNERLRQSIEASIKLGYRPSRFIEMLKGTDAVTLAKQLVRTGEIQDGLKQIKALGKIELAMESIMLEPEFADEFTSEELDAARWRLQQL